MSLRRVVEQYPHSLEAQLVRAGRAVKAPPSTIKSTLRAVGVGAAVTGSAITVAPSAYAKLLSLVGQLSVKWTAISLFAVAGTVAATRIPAISNAAPAPTVLGARGESRAPKTGAGSKLQTPASRVDPPLATEPPPPASPIEVTASPPVQPQGLSAAMASAKSESRRATTAPVDTAPQKAQAPGATVADPAWTGTTQADARESLGAEVSLIDAARQAIDGNSPEHALGLLQQHARLKKPRLSQEAALLRVRALQQLGRAAEADEALQSLRRSYPQSSLAGPR